MEAIRKLLVGLVAAVALVLAVALALQALVVSPPSPPGAVRLAFAIGTDRTAYALGETANVTITLTNVGATSANLTFPNPCYWEYHVYDSGNRAVFNSSYLLACIVMIAHLALGPGQSAVFHTRWALVTDQGTPVPVPATYRLVPSFAWYLVEDQALVVRTDTVAISVSP